jgi:excisionase family DNA binding protein
MGDELLTTGQAARLLGCSRQHVVDLCMSGRVPFEVIGSHRRVRRSEVERLRGRFLTRDQERSWWLHHAVAGRLVADPEFVDASARRRLVEMGERHAGGAVVGSFEDWQRILDGGPALVLEALTSRENWAVELRQNSPFAGVLSVEERQSVLTSFRKYWRTQMAA